MLGSIMDSVAEEKMEKAKEKHSARSLGELSRQSLSTSDFSYMQHSVKNHFRIIQQLIQETESKLNPDEELLFKFVSFGTPVLMSIQKIAFKNPDLFVFYGLIDNQPCTLVQHQNQLNLLFLTHKIEPGKQPNKIGFEISD